MSLPPPLPAPPPPPKPQRRWLRLSLVAVSIGLAIGVVGAYVDIPFYTLGPGPAKDVGELIRVSGERVYPSSGEFFLTTVAVGQQQVSLFEAVVGWIDPAVSVVPRREIIRPGLTDEQQGQYNALDMEESKYAALLAALHALGKNAPLVPGARVIGVAKGFPADGSLKGGDLIVTVDGRTVKDVATAAMAIAVHPVGSTVTVEALRGDERVRVQMRTVRSPDPDEKNRPIIGIRLAPAVRLPFDVTIDSENIGGPSAGLAFALSITDALTEEDFTRGHHVAVTGTIDSAGHVGPVGGVRFKVVAAEREGADTFLVPSDEVAQARAAAKHATVIGVATLADALAALRRLAQIAPSR